MGSAAARMKGLRDSNKCSPVRRRYASWTCHRRYPGGTTQASLVSTSGSPFPIGFRIGSRNTRFRGLLSVHSRYGLHILADSARAVSSASVKSLPL